MMNSSFSLDFAVRDYECDYEGIVNNAVYLNYLEHARHEYLKETGIKPVELAKQGINLVVIRVEMDYLWSLRSGDTFYIKVGMERVSRLRFAFLQDIYRKPDDKPILKARVMGTSIDNAGRPKLFPEVEALLGLASRE
jgi:acyl-CoA thioester hydrolase